MRQSQTFGIASGILMFTGLSNRAILIDMQNKQLPISDHRGTMQYFNFCKQAVSKVPSISLKDEFYHNCIDVT